MLDKCKKDPAGKGDGFEYLEYFKELHKDDKENKDDFYLNIIESAEEE